MTLLCDIAYKYKTDKCPQVLHNYTPFYWEQLKDRRESVRKVLEFGIGCPMNMARFHKDYQTGASLRMWRDFFPNAQIYGADILPETQIEDERIKTFICNEHDGDAIRNLIQTIGSDIDILIDDASHYYTEQNFLCRTLMPLLPKDVFYSIEDVRSTHLLLRTIGQKYECFAPDLHPLKSIYRDSIIIVKNK